MKSIQALASVSVVLLMAGCNSAITVLPAPSPLIQLQQQTIEGWPANTGLTGTLVLETYSPQGSQTLATTPISATGKFDLNLPVPLWNEMRRIGENPPPGCTMNMQFSNPDALVAAAGASVQINGKRVFLTAANTAQQEAGSLQYVFLYSNEHLTLKGTTSCTFNSSTQVTTYDVVAKKGWNVIINKNTSPTANTYTSTTQVPADLKWWPSQPIHGFLNVFTNQQIQGWESSKSSKIRFTMGGLGGNIQDTQGAIVAAVTAQGTFSIELPTPLNSHLIAPSQLLPGCTGNLLPSNPDARLGVITTAAINSQGNSIAALEAASASPFGTPAPGDRQYFLTYADRDVVLSGTLSCGSAQVSVQSNLKTGWNYLVATLNGLNGGMNISFTATQSVPADLKWWSFFFATVREQPGLSSLWKTEK